jgi:hypothetical protein
MAADRSNAERRAVVLTSQERRELARLEAVFALADPGLDRSLRSGRPVRWHQGLTQSLTRRQPRAMGVVAGLIWLVGAVLMLATFTQSVLLALFGAGLQIVGMALAVDQGRQWLLRRSKTLAGDEAVSAQE